MPGSSAVGKDAVLDWFVGNRSEFRDVLDVGPGWGTYFDLLNPAASGSLNWECVEVWEPYIYRFELYKKYSEIYNVSILDFRPGKNYDLAILGDVLEHLPKEEAVIAVNRIRRFSKYYIVSLPLDSETGAGPGTGDKDWGNPFELHRSQWSDSEFRSLGFSDEFVFARKEGGMAVYIGKSRAFAPHSGFRNSTPPTSPALKSSARSGTESRS